MPPDRALDTWTRLRLAGGDPGPRPTPTPRPIAAAALRAIEEDVAREARATARTRKSDEADLELKRKWRLYAATTQFGPVDPTLTSIPWWILDRQWERTHEEMGPTDPTRAARWAAQVEQIAARFGVTVHEFSEAPGLAWSRARHILIPPVRSALSYACAMHELGHVACAAAGHTHRAARSAVDGSRISPAGEVCAWRFAIERACPHWSRLMQSSMVRGLASYLKYADVDEARTMRALMNQIGGLDI